MCKPVGRCVRRPVILFLAVALLPCISQRAGAQWPSTGSPVVTIGMEDGPDPYLLGHISRVTTDRRGNVYVLDGMADRITRYDSTGRFLGQIGRKGAGPGELRDVRDLGLDSGMNLHVLDTGNRRITVFDVSSPRAEYVTSHAMPVAAVALCIAGSRRFLLTPPPLSDALIHEIAADGTVIRKFGSPVVASGSLAREFGERALHPLSQGSITCDSVQRRLFFANTRGHVRAYAFDGRLLWSRDLQALTPTLLARSPKLSGDGCCVFGPEGENTGRAVIQGASIWIPVTRTAVKDRSFVFRYTTRLLRAVDGVETSRVSAPAVLDAIRDYAVAHRSGDQFPAVFVYK